MTKNKFSDSIHMLAGSLRPYVSWLIGIGFLLLAGMNAGHAATMTRSPSNCVSTGPGTAWNNAGRAETNNSSYATVTLDGSTSEYLRCTNYGFSIPAGAVINGIIVTVERRASNDNGGGSWDAAMRIVQGGVIGTADRSTATSYPIFDMEEAHGGSADLWGLAWTPADINATDFGAAFRATKPSARASSHTISVDHIEITVDYTPETTPPTVTGISTYCGGINQLLVNFSEPLNAASAQMVGNYVLSGGIAVTSATLQSDGMSVLLRTSSLPAGSYTLTVSGVQDVAGNQILATSQPVSVNGVVTPGVRGAYYIGTSDQFPGTPVVRIENTINFDWANGAPIAGIPTDQFSVRWTGFVLAPATGNYVLRTRSDDGVRLYLDGQTVINNWTDHAATNNDSSTLALNGGQYYALQMDFYENGGQAVAQFSGDYNNTGFQIVPAEYLFYCQIPTAVTPGRFNAVDTGAAINGPITTKVAASAFVLDLIALNAAGTAVQTNFTGDVKMELLGNIAAGIATDGNNCPITSTVIGSGAATFGTTDNGRKADVPFNATTYAGTANAWRDVRVRISYPATGTATVVSCSSDNFAIRPASFGAISVTDNTWATAGNARTLSNTNVNGGVVHKAGQPFRISFTAYNSAANVTTNYDGPPTLNAAACSNVNSACTSAVGLVSAPSWSSNSGVLASAAATYSEVGSFSLQIQDTAFAAVDSSDGSTPAQKNVPVVTVPVVGRFVPDHFDVTPVSGNTPMFKTFNDTACASRSFTYIGQSFGYVTVPQVVISARNAANGITTNYRGAWRKYTGTNVSRSYSSASGAITMTAGSAPAIAEIPSANGTATAAIDAGEEIRFDRNGSTPQAPFAANIVLTVSVSDTAEPDGTIATASPAVFDGGGTGILFDSGNQFRYGILKLANAHGSELLRLPVPTEVQFWNGSNFVRNTADNCTAITASNVSVSNFKKDLSACETATSFSGRFSAGRGNLALSAPGANNTGSVDLRINLGMAPGDACITAGPSTTAVTSANRDYLQIKSGASYTADPTARASFGVRKSGPVIYVREIY